MAAYTINATTPVGLPAKTVAAGGRYRQTYAHYDGLQDTLCKRPHAASTHTTVVVFARSRHTQLPKSHRALAAAGTVPYQVHGGTA